jgi:hypothetical protein
MYWRYRNNIWEAPDTEHLDDLKVDKLEWLSKKYNEYDASAFIQTSLSFPVQIGQIHISKLDGAIRYADMMNQPVIYITDANNITHENISLSDANNILKEVMGAAMIAHHHKQELRTAIAAVDTVEALIKIRWNL